MGKIFNFHYINKKSLRNLWDLNIPRLFSEKLENHSKILQDLVKKRSTAAYGYVDGITEEDFEEDAKYFKVPVKEVIDDCNKLINEYHKEQKNIINQTEEKEDEEDLV